MSYVTLIASLDGSITYCARAYGGGPGVYVDFARLNVQVPNHASITGWLAGDWTSTARARAASIEIADYRRAGSPHGQRAPSDRTDSLHAHRAEERAAA